MSALSVPLSSDTQESLLAKLKSKPKNLNKDIAFALLTKDLQRTQPKMMPMSHAAETIPKPETVVKSVNQAKQDRQDNKHSEPQALIQTKAMKTIDIQTVRQDQIAKLTQTDEFKKAEVEVKEPKQQKPICVAKQCQTDAPPAMVPKAAQTDVPIQVARPCQTDQPLRASQSVQTTL